MPRPEDEVLTMTRAQLEQALMEWSENRAQAIIEKLFMWQSVNKSIASSKR